MRCTLLTRRSAFVLKVDVSHRWQSVHSVAEAIVALNNLVSLL